MYVITISRHDKRVVIAAVLLVVLLLALILIPIVGNAVSAAEGKSDENIGHYPGEPIRVLSGGIDNLSVWEAIIQHYSF